MRKKINLNILQTLYLSVVCGSFLVVFQSGNEMLSISFILILILSVVLISFKNYSSNIPFVMFLFCFSTFLLGRVIVTSFFNYKSNQMGILGTSFISKDIVNSILLMIFTSVIFLYIGFQLRISNEFNFRTENKIDFFYRKVSKMLFLFTFIFRFFMLVEMIRTTTTTGYVETFATFQSSLPGVLQILADMSDISLFIYLCTLPTKKEATPYVLLYFLDGVMGLFSGRRSIFLLNMIILIIYYFYRNYWTGSKEKWIKKRFIIALVFLIPFVLIVLNYIGGSRDGEVYKTQGIFGSAKEFFYTQGVSINILGYTQYFESSLPSNNYTFGPIIEFIKKNLFFESGNQYFGQNVYRALNGNLFSHTISYYINPTLYLKGVGYGGSFIAELYYDFGFIGISVGSLFYGFVLRNFYLWLCKTSPIVRGVLFIMLRQIMFSPRSGFTNFIATALALPNLIAVCIIVFISFVLNDIFNKGYGKLNEK